MSMSQNLALDYGRSSEYSEGQVKTVLKKLKYDKSFEEIAIAIFSNEEIASAYGIDDALIKEYKGYPRRHGVGVGADALGDHTGSFGDGGGSD